MLKQNNHRVYEKTLVLLSPSNHWAFTHASNCSLIGEGHAQDECGLCLSLHDTHTHTHTHTWSCRWVKEKEKCRLVGLGRKRQRVQSVKWTCDCVCLCVDMCVGVTVRDTEEKGELLLCLCLSFFFTLCVAWERRRLRRCAFVCVDGCAEQEEDMRGTETKAQTTRTHTHTHTNTRAHTKERERKKKEKTRIVSSKTERKIMKVSCWDNGEIKPRRRVCRMMWNKWPALKNTGPGVSWWKHTCRRRLI